MGMTPDSTCGEEGGGGVQADMALPTLGCDPFSLILLISGIS